MATTSILDEILGELAALEDAKMREANERHGDDHGVNLAKLRALAKRLKTQHELALELWKTGDTAARLLATLVCKPKALTADDLDAMIRDIRSPRLLDWFVVNVVKPGRHAEELRLRWKDGGNLVGRAGWSLTTARVVKKAQGLDLPALLDQIEKEMKQAPAEKQWAMNHCLAEIGIHHASLRSRAIKIGERLKVRHRLPGLSGLYAAGCAYVDRRAGAPARRGLSAGDAEHNRPCKAARGGLLDGIEDSRRRLVRDVPSAEWAGTVPRSSGAWRLRWGNPGILLGSPGS
jgi:3-methyladenine DNA glycosylase AlkD